MLRATIWLAAVGIFFSAFATQAQKAPYVAYLKDVEAEMIQDGDTPLIEIRMYGIDTPEKHQECARSDGTCWRCGKRATEVLAGLLHDQKARYEFTGASTYGRPVATIFIGAKDINLEMVRQGHAVVYTEFLDDSLKDKYLDVQQEAKDAKRGIWQGNFIRPNKWRQGERLACEK